MALEYTFYPLLRDSLGNPINVVQGLELGTGSIAVGAASAVGILIAPAYAGLVLLLPGEDCRISIGSAPVASKTAGSLTRKLIYGNEYLFFCNPGDKVAVIQPV